MAVRNSGKCQGTVRAFRVTSCPLWDFHLSWNRLRPEVAPGTPDALSRCRVMDASGSVSNNGSAISRTKEEKEVGGSVACLILPARRIISLITLPLFPGQSSCRARAVRLFRKFFPCLVVASDYRRRRAQPGELGRFAGQDRHHVARNVAVLASSRPRGAGLRRRQQSSIHAVPG